MKYLSKKRVYLVLLFFVSLFTLLALSFTLFSMSVKISDMWNGETHKETAVYTGFSLLGQGKDINDAIESFSGLVSQGVQDMKGSITAINVFSILQIVASSVVLLGSIVLFVVMGDRTPKKVLLIATAVCVAFLLIYMIEGIVIASTIMAKVKAYFKAEVPNNWKEWMNLLGLRTGTAAFVPTIIVAVLMGVYFLFRSKLPDVGEPFAPLFESLRSGVSVAPSVPKKTTASYSVKQEMEKIELLKQYKEMLDNGILTQEEFDAKKKDLL